MDVMLARTSGQDGESFHAARSPRAERVAAGEEVADCCASGIGELAATMFSALESSQAERRWLERAALAAAIPGRAAAVAALVEVLERCRSAQSRLRQVEDEIELLRKRLSDEQVGLPREFDDDFHGIIGRSAPMRQVLRSIEQVAPTDAIVLVQGETGTGKELIARAIHARSPRRARRMVKVNCAALPSTLIESELFGREKGAYTGAISRQAGRFEAADGSTLFLDEIGELSLDAQAKLLRVLQEGEFERLGSSTTQKVNVRVIAATNRDLGAAVKAGTFREDLYYRLGVFPIRVPPLRDRREDLPELVWAFVREFAESMGRCVESISRRSMDALQACPWPGNIRELRNTVERALIVHDGPVLQLDPPDSDAAVAADITSLEEVERRHIQAILARTRWRIRGRHGAAQLIGLKPTTLESRMQKLGIRRPAVA